MSSREKQRVGSTVWSVVLGLVIGVGSGVGASQAADWSTTEFHFQYGELDNAFAPGSSDTFIWTLQHASGWKYGDNFFFVDIIDDQDGNNYDIYAEVYPNFSLSKITGNEISMGPINDVGIITGFNFGADPNVRVFLPGIRLSWDLPGFAFANTDFTAYLTDNQGASEDDPRSAPSAGDSWMVDFNFSTKQWELGATKWNLEGHVEYIDSRSNEFGETDYWILGQPQLRVDVGEHIGLPASTLFAGVEYQFWINKLGGEKDESAVQALVVWRL